MSYSTTEAINVLLGPHAVTATTPLTLTELQALMTSVSLRIDAVLRGCGLTTVPVTDATFKAYLGTIEAWGAAAQALKSLFPEATGAGEQPAYAYWQKLFDNAMADLCSLVPGHLIGTEKHESSSYFTNNPDRDADLGDLEGANLFRTDPKDETPW